MSCHCHNGNMNPKVICLIPSPNLTANASGNSLDICASQIGLCTVCKRQMHIVNSTGLLRTHVPQSNECKGSLSRPFLGSQQLTPSHVTGVTRQTIQSAPPSSQPSAAAPTVDLATATTTGSSPTDACDIIHHPARCRQIGLLKWIQKGAWPAAANLLQKLINDVLLHPSSQSS